MANDWTMAEAREIIYQNLLALDTSVMELTLRAEGHNQCLYSLRSGASGQLPS